MTKSKFTTLLTTSIVVSLLFIAQVLVARQTQASNQQFVGLQRLIGEGRQYYTLWQQLASRTYQLSQQNQDQALKDLLNRQQVVITPKAGANPSPADATVPPVSSTPGRGTTNQPR